MRSRSRDEARISFSSTGVGESDDGSACNAGVASLMPKACSPFARIRGYAVIGADPEF